jgi:chromate reductase
MEALDIGVIVGSLRKGSYNRQLFDNSHALTPEGLVLREIPVRKLPLFDQDVLEQYPASVVEYWDAVRKADGILFISPEYNYSVPGVVKNAFDWASRPPDSAAIAGKPAGVLGASTGRSGTMRMQLHMRQILPALNMAVMPKPEVFIMNAADIFDETGYLHDERIRKQLTRFYAAFEPWARKFAKRDS